MDKNEFSDKIRKTAFSYIPELYWNRDGYNPGTALLILGGELLGTDAKKISRLPEKHRLELFGASARYEKVKTSFGIFAEIITDKAVLLKKGAEFKTDGSGGVFRLAENFMASRAEIREIILTNPGKNNFIKAAGKTPTFTADSYINAEKGSCRLMFYCDNLLYGAEEMLFTANTDPEILKLTADPESVRWSVLTDENEEILTAKAVKNGIKLTADKRFSEAKENCAVSAEILNIAALSEKTFDEPAFRISGESLNPDIIIQNGEALTETAELYPFGSPIDERGELYISCEEAFSKKGGKISIRFYLYTDETAFELGAAANIDFEKLYGKKLGSQIKQNLPKEKTCTVEKTAFSYFNGEGFVPLPGLEAYKDIFDGKKNGFCEIAFTVPKDIQPCEINGAERRWLRIKPERCGDVYYRPCKMLCPLIRNIKINYSVLVKPNLLKRKITNSAGEFSEETDGIICKNPYGSKHEPYLYIGVSGKLKNTLSVLFSCGSSGCRTVYGGWEISAGDGFIPVQFSDETDGLSRYGRITFTVPRSAEAVNCFNSETALYYFRSGILTETASPREITAVCVNAAEFIYDGDYLPEKTVINMHEPEYGDIKALTLSDASDNNADTTEKEEEYAAMLKIKNAEALITGEDIKAVLLFYFPAVSEVKCGAADGKMTVCISFKDFSRQGELFLKHKSAISSLMSESGREVRIVSPQTAFMCVRAETAAETGSSLDTDLSEIKEMLSVFLSHKKGTVRQIGELPTAEETAAFLHSRGAEVRKVVVTARVYTETGCREYLPEELTNGFYLSEAGEIILKS